VTIKPWPPEVEKTARAGKAPHYEGRLREWYIIVKV